ncbi:hypothetical protein C3Y87_05600 [Carbonactinospora thermoautotrophica]|nr:hypothetical protein [Carbonactinospora thermoautotrophica]
MASSLGTSLGRFGAVLQEVFCTVLPEGGQRTARRNAWRAVCADRIQARAREEAWRELERLARRNTTEEGKLTAL